jgi:hypothetical protein
MKDPNKRECLLCQKTYSKRKNESAERFAFRMYCGLACSRKAQRSLGTRFGYGYHGPTEGEREAIRNR